MIFKSVSKVANQVWGLALPLAQKINLEIWDVSFEKEGACWYLKVFLEKPGGSIGLEDCEEFSRELSQLLDEADPIPQSYFLEVSSPGIERELSKPEHFKRYEGATILVKLVRPVNGMRELTGKLLCATKEALKLEVNQEAQTITANMVAKIKLYYEFPF